MNKKYNKKSVRKIFRIGRSYAVTLPMEVMEELRWKKGQKLVVTKYGKGFRIRDWQK